MSYISGNTYEYVGWLPNTIGIKIYTIYANDSSGNVNFLSDFITVIDTTGPNLSGLFESADPLELGIYEMIQIEAYDEDGVDTVWIEIEGIDYLMSYVGGNIYEYTGWIPTTIGVKIYTIYANDTNGNIDFLSDFITVIDTTGPSLSGLFESADPLELGNSETIMINISDHSPIDNVWIEIEGIEILMNYVSGFTYEYSGWNPTAIGVKSYTIYANDTNGNINFLPDSIMVIDTTGPILSGLFESADPLELGMSETIQIDLFDLSPIDTVWIEIESIEILMSFISGNTYEYAGWTPITIGVKNYMIYANDTSGNVNFLSDAITVVDTTGPSLFGLSESADPLELGMSETIQINVTDLTSIDSVWIEIESIEILMSFISGNTYEYAGWTPITIGVKNYMIYANDTSGNVNFLLEAIIVIDTTPPLLSGLFESVDPLELGFSETIQIDVFDLSPIDTVWIEIEGVNFIMNFFSGNTYGHSNWIPNMIGLNNYTIYTNDTSGNINFLSEAITVIDTTEPLLSGLFESSDPLELGNSEKIQIDAFDLSPIDTVWIEIEGVNFTMNHISGNTYEHSDWTPNMVGVKNYIIYANDTSGNLNLFSDTITVIDTTPPQIIIREPNPYDQYGIIAPEVDIEFLDYDLDNTWYQIIGTITTANYTWTGAIAQSLWDQMGNGLVVIQFYANDSSGNFNSNYVIVKKDSSAPDVTINSPENDQLYGYLPPVIDVDFGSDAIYEWFQLIGTVTTSNYTWTGTISQEIWDEVGNGTVIIYIYANDSLGNLGYDSVRINKDIIEPNIIINEPAPYSLFGKIAPVFDLDIDEGNLNQTWYQIIGTTTTNNYTWTGIIAQNLWNQMDNGTVTIVFYANDTIGNFGSELIVIRKDIIAPQIIISQPDSNDLFGKSTPEVNVEFLDPNLGSTWYQLSNGSISTNNYTWLGSINQIVWDQIGNGSVNIIFYAIDTIDNLNSTMVIVRKDIKKPSISIIQPHIYELFGETSPIVNININDRHLKAVWYQLSNELIRTANYSWMGLIDQTVWDQIGNGTVNIIFYANDSVRNFASENVIVRKDVISPQITIIEPSNYDLFGNTPPNVNLEVIEPNLNEIWCQLTDGTISTNYTWNGNITQSAWNMFGTGLVTIKIYANDSVGNLGSKSVVIRKDVTAPDIVIYEPNPFDLFGLSAPIVDVDVSDPNLDTISYKLYNNTKSSLIYLWLGSIEQLVWDEFRSSVITIRIYANDTMGNTRFSDVTIIKDITKPTIDINFPNPYDLFGIDPPNLIINIYDQNLDRVWYQLTNGIETTLNYTWSGNIPLNIWNEMGNGTVTIIIYANDTVSNFRSQFITIRKDIIAPIINIDSPGNFSLYGRTPPEVFITVYEPNLDNIRYQLKIGEISTQNYSWTGILEQNVWDEVGNGTISIIFYIKDAVGNFASVILIVRKDIIAPQILIQEPIASDLFGTLPPNVSVDIEDPNLSSVWYQLRNGTINTMNYTWTGLIEQTTWNQVGNGSVYLTFYANDSLGNLGSKSVLIQKDIIGPKLIINYPNPYDVFGITAPNINIEIEDKNLFTSWYCLKNETTTTLNYTWIGILEQSIWDQFVNGLVTIFFYANDSMSNFNYINLSLVKDLNAPIINIIEPENFAVIGQIAPDFEVYISGIDIHQSWYVFAGELVKYFFINTDGTTIVTLNQTKWDEFGNGTVTIEFYVNDSVGNIGFDIVELRKDVYAPEILINLPIYEGYWNKPPILNISYFDPNFDTLWYKIGIFSGILINNTEDCIDPLIWDSLEQGEHQLFIYANDTAGNVNDSYVFTIYKDTLAPMITIHSPVNESYSDSPPIFNISFYDPNYDSLWYGNGFINITLVNNTNQFLDWNIWNDQPEGIYQIVIYANDTFGHLNDKYIITLYKDTKAPIITINSPNNNTYYNSPPTLNIVASDPNFDSLWYKVRNEIIKITQPFQDFDAFIWDILDQGEFQVEIFANDTFGHINSDYYLILFKDTLAPKIIINSPLNQTYWNTRPILNITALDPNLISLYYKVNTYLVWLTNNTATLLSSPIWQGLAEGEFKVQIFAIDDFGYINDSYTLTLFKDTIKPNITVDYPNTNSLYGANPPEFSISASKFNLDSVWYELLGYPKNFILFEFTGMINQEAWDSFGNGTVTIRFYANDTTGNFGIKDIIVRKDVSVPIIKVYKPFEYTIWDVPPIINVSVSDNNLDSIWYRIGTMSSILYSDIEQQLDNLIWQSIPEGEFHIYIYANDTFGNINDSFYIILYKDTLAPDITINLPTLYQEIGNIAPNFNISIVEDNLQNCWYTIDEGLINFTFNTNIGQIDQQIWDEKWEASYHGDLVTITFYANDTLGHLGYQDIIVKIRKPGLFDLKNPNLFLTTGIAESVLFVSLISLKKNKRYKRMDKRQKKRLNSILYLSLLLTGLFLLTSFI
ncbi:MAG: hypothetical protein ACFFEO_01270 [Candidatus Thorarchaeota archaeon]